MKRYLLLIIVLFMLGCSNNIEIQKDYYISLKKDLNNITKYTENEDIPFDILVNVKRLTDYEIMYTVTIDNPVSDISDILALVVHNQPTSDVFPSIGIFDDKINLIPDNPDVKGIVLVGYIETEEDIVNLDLEFKILVEYNKDNKTNKIYYKVTKYE